MRELIDEDTGTLAGRGKVAPRRALEGDGPNLIPNATKILQFRLADTRPDERMPAPEARSARQANRS